MPDGIVRVYGLDRYTSINEDGSFEIDNIPAGDFTLYVTFSNIGSEEGSTVEVEAESGETTLLDTLFQLFYTSPDGDTLPSTRQLYQIGESITAPGPPENEGYEFIGWATSDNESTDIYAPGDTLILSNSASILHPQWKRIYYRLLLSTSGKGSASVPDSVGHGTPVTITATPDEGEEFIGWKVVQGSAEIEDAHVATTDILLTDGDATIQAVFTPLTFLKYYPGAYVAGSYFGNNISQTADGGYIATFRSRNDGFSSRLPIHLLKTDRFGDTVWTKSFCDGKDPGTYFATPTNVLQSDDNGYVVLTTSMGQKEFSLFKTDHSGTLLWNKVYAEEKGGYWPAELHETQLMHADDGGFLVVISRFSVALDPYRHTDRAFVVLKIATDGNVQWTRYFSTLSSVVSPLSSGKIVARTNHGGYFLTGTSTDAADSGHQVIVRLDSEGNTLWRKIVDKDNILQFRQLHATSDGGCRFIGSTDVGLCYGNVTEDGDVIVTRQMNFSTPESNWSLLQTPDDSFIFAAGRDGTMFLMKLTAEGITEWTTDLSSYNYDNVQIQRAYHVRQTEDGGFFVTGLAADEDFFGFFQLKTDENGDIYY